MSDKKQEHKLEKVLHLLFSDLRRKELDKLEAYIRKHDLYSLIYNFSKKPDRMYREATLDEDERKKFRLLRRIKLANYIVDKKSVLRRGVQDYVWIFTPKYVDLEPLKKTYDYVHPFEPLLLKLNEGEITDPNFALRIGMVKGKISTLGDLTDEQMKKLEELALRVYNMAKTGEKIEAKEIIPFFNAGLKEIGITRNKI